MEDRIPTPGQAGRMLITPEDGSPPYYAVLTMADNPTQEGTPLNKETLLQDGTEVQIFGNANNRTVDDAFSGVMYRINLIMQNVANMTLTVTDASGNPLEGVYVNGIFDDNGDTVQTNASGQAIGFVAEGDTTLSITNYADIEDYSEAFTAIKGQQYTKTIQVTTRDFLRILRTGNYRFSGNVNQVDVNPVGGGAGGAYGYMTSEYLYSGRGGSGGESIIQNSVTFSANVLYPAVVGAGGAASMNESTIAGGASSFLGVSANGGSDASVNSPGGLRVSYARSRAGAINGNPGGASTVQMFDSFSAMAACSGGGGSGGIAYRYLTSSLIDGSGGTGGSPFGGKGGDANLGGSPPNGSEPGKGIGGGGGGGSLSEIDDGGDRLNTHFGNGATGYQGCINVRMHLKTAA